MKREIEKILVKGIVKLNPLMYTKLGVKFRHLIKPRLSDAFEQTIYNDVVHKLYFDEDKEEYVTYIKGDKPTIYAANHVFYDDISSVICSVRDRRMMLIADKGTLETISSVDAIGLVLNGVYFFEKDKDRLFDNKLKKDKSLKKLTDEEAIEKKKDILYKREVDQMFKTLKKVMKHGDDVLYFPESTWNLSMEKILTGDLPWGMLKEIAYDLEADVVPVGVDLVDNENVVVFGEKLDLTMNPSEDINNLKDKMATLVWFIYEMKEKLVRSDINDIYEYWHNDRTKVHRGELESPDNDFNYETRNLFRGKNNINVDNERSDKYRLDEIVAEMNGIDLPIGQFIDKEEYLKVVELTNLYNKKANIMKNKINNEVILTKRR